MKNTNKNTEISMPMVYDDSCKENNYNCDIYLDPEDLIKTYIIVEMSSDCAEAQAHVELFKKWLALEETDTHNKFFYDGDIMSLNEVIDNCTSCRTGKKFGMKCTLVEA